LTERRGIPRRPVFWTLDQIADMLDLPQKTLVKSYLWLEGRDKGIYRLHYLRAVNLAFTKVNPDGVQKQSVNEWRVAEDEFLRWLTFHKLWIYEPSFAPFSASNPTDRTTSTSSEPTGTLVDIVYPTEERA
jgi:hypothetical protein